jgi:hypothetical protein
LKKEEFQLLKSNYFSAKKVEEELRKTDEITPLYQQKSNEIRIEIPKNVSQ